MHVYVSVCASGRLGSSVISSQAGFWMCLFVCVRVCLLHWHPRMRVYLCTYALHADLSTFMCISVHKAGAV